MLISVTELLTYADCPRRYHYSVQRRLRRPVIGVPPANVGTAFHAALAAHYRGEDPFKAGRASFEGLDWATDDLAFLNSLITSYLARPPYPHHEVLAIEKELRAPLIPGVDLCGTLDLVLRDIQTAERILVDHKTAHASASPLQYHTSFQLSLQPHLYGHLWRANGLPPLAGASLTLCRKTKVPDIHSFHIHLSDASIDAALVEARAYAHAITTDILHLRNPHSCVRWNRVCDYANLCLGLPFFPGEWATAPLRYTEDTDAPHPASE